MAPPATRLFGVEPVADFRRQRADIGHHDHRQLLVEELADRLVPDLGLDEAGTLLLDFGPRQFTVGFDEALKPYARDASGAPLKDLPKPNKSADAALAEEASERWKALKQDARTLASQQILRLELAMAQRRRWSAAIFGGSGFLFNWIESKPLVLAQLAATGIALAIANLDTAFVVWYVALVLLTGLVLAGAPSAVAQTPTLTAAVRAAIAKQDFAGAEQLVANDRKARGVTPDGLEAMSWLGRGALAAECDVGPGLHRIPDADHHCFVS